MPVGKLVIVCFHEDANGVAVLDSVDFRDWSHLPADVTGSAVVEKDDFTNNLNDAFCVQWSVVNADVATYVAKTGSTHLTDAIAAVNAAFPSGGGVSPNN